MTPHPMPDSEHGSASGGKPITIGGGGLCGLSLGIALRREGIPARIFESGSYPRHRVCGEFISGVSDATLDALGIRDILDQATPLHTFSWHSPHRCLIQSALPTPARGLSRFALDQALANRFEDLGGSLHTCSKAPAPSDNGGLSIDTTGRARTRGRKWVGLKIHFTELDLTSDLEMHAGDGGYIGLSRIENGRVNACGLFLHRPGLRGGGPDTLLRYLEACGLHSLAERLHPQPRDDASFSAVAGFEMGDAPPSPQNTLRLGDALMMIPPFAGNGMSMAFESAAIALDHIRKHNQGDLPREHMIRDTESALASRFASRMRAATLLHPMLLRPALRAPLSLLAALRLLPTATLFNALRN